ncbi:MAG: ACP S-malonyltransferase [Treponema sp.]|nr:ACP S-malonyltransferase [Treponema sp.]
MEIINIKNFFLFPGQGAQYPGMSLDFLVSGSPGVKKIFDLASDITGHNMEALLRDTDAETLKRTDVSQPALTLANLAAAVYLADQGLAPAGAAGFSLGEYAALAAAGVISGEDCFRLVKARGEAMQAAAERIAAETAGEAAGMAAVIGLAPEQAEALIAEWTAGGLGGLYPANINSPRQLVVSGTAPALAEAEARFKDAGARRFIRLQVAGPFHSPLIAGAAEQFRPVLEAVPFSDPAIPFYSNVTGKRVHSGGEAKTLALRQITEPVRWINEERAIDTAGGIGALLECGPGKVLQGLWKDSGSAIPCYAAGTVEDVQILFKSRAAVPKTEV